MIVLPFSSSMARTRPEYGTDQNRVAAFQGTGLHQQGRHRALALVQTCFNHDALGAGVLRCFQFQHFGLQQNAFQQRIDALAGLGGHFNEHRIATPVFRNHAFGHQFLAHALGIGIRFVDLGHGHHDRHTCRLGVVNRFLGLRHHAVVRCHHQNHDVGRFRAACTHRGKRLVARRIEEGDHAARRIHVVGADMLRDTARFATRHTGTADVVQQGSLAVVDVTHDGHDRRARFQHHIAMIDRFHQEGIGIVRLGRNRLVSHFFDQNHRCLLIQHLVDSDHGAHLHQGLDDLGRLDRHLLRQLGHGDGFRNHHFLHDGFSRQRECVCRLRLAVFVMTRRADRAAAGTSAQSGTGIGSCAKAGVSCVRPHPKDYPWRQPCRLSWRDAQPCRPA